ncbi:TPA: pre-peptidase C-terminal domain-containing protein [Bacillus cereus]
MWDERICHVHLRFQKYQDNLKKNDIGKKTLGLEIDWRNLNEIVDSTLKQLSNKSWNGYKTVTAYFTNYRVNTNNQIECEIVFQGGSKNILVSKEPNDSIKNTTALPLNTNFVGTFDAKNTLDIYQLDVQELKNLTIQITNQNKIQMNWILYHENDLKTPITYATFQGQNLVGTYRAQPGEYYLYVYNYDKNPGGYQGIVTIK